MLWASYQKSTALHHRTRDPAYKIAFLVWQTNPIHRFPYLWQNCCGNTCAFHHRPPYFTFTAHACRIICNSWHVRCPSSYTDVMTNKLQLQLYFTQLFELLSCLLIKLNTMTCRATPSKWRSTPSISLSIMHSVFFHHPDKLQPRTHTSQYTPTLIF
jgi:hypothetical protein